MNTMNPAPDSWVVEDPDGRFYYRITVKDDTDTVPEEFDCYDDADRAAWHRDKWTFAVVTVTPVLRDGAVVFEGAAQNVGSVEWGSRPGREIGRTQIWEHPAAELAVKARAEAEKMIDRLAGRE